MTSEVWWTPAFPFKSSLTGEPADRLRTRGKARRRSNGRSRSAIHTLFGKSSIDMLKRAKNPLDRASIRDSLKATDLNTLVGQVNFSGKPASECLQDAGSGRPVGQG